MVGLNQNILTQVEAVVEVELENVLKINFNKWVGVARLLDQVVISLSQYLSKLKLKLKLS